MAIWNCNGLAKHQMELELFLSNHDIDIMMICETHFTHDQTHLQATSVSINLWNGSIVVSAIYCPPKHNIKQHDFNDFFKTLSNKFIAGGDYNAKHTFWGSRLTTTRGRELRKIMLAENFEHISSAEPSYWSTDPNKLPDLLRNQWHIFKLHKSVILFGTFL